MGKMPYIPMRVIGLEKFEVFSETPNGKLKKLFPRSNKRFEIYDFQKGKIYRIISQRGDFKFELREHGRIRKLGGNLPIKLVLL